MTHSEVPAGIEPASPEEISSINRSSESNVLTITPRDPLLGWNQIALTWTIFVFGFSNCGSYSTTMAGGDRDLIGGPPTTSESLTSIARLSFKII